MTVPYFLDTNILLYAAAGRETAEPRRRRARELMVGARFGTSVQVLQEFYRNVTRKIARPLPPERAPCPLWPRPDVLPWPEPSPRPTRLRFLFEPGAGVSSLSRI